MTGGRLFAPATQRNRDPILAVLREVLPREGRVLEIASGSGEHVTHFAKAFPGLTFQPTDPDPQAVASIAAWSNDAALANLEAPLLFDASQPEWPFHGLAGILCINMIHIAPWRATQGLMRGAAASLRPDAPLYLYGPYRQRGVPTADSNDAFDADLRARNPAWGLRDLDEVAELARASGFSQPQITPMPANNLSVIFRLASA